MVFRPFAFKFCTKISEPHLLPVLEARLHQFPFLILGFHADNGSEFVNHTVAKLLNKMLVDFTRSRPLFTSATLDSWPISQSLTNRLPPSVTVRRY